VALFASVHVFAAAIVEPVLPPVNEAELLRDTDARIQDARTAPLMVRVVDVNGKPVSGRTVRVEQVKHSFYFGAGFDTALLPRDTETETDKRHRENFLKLFNYSTVHIYWGGYELKHGEYQDSQRLKSITWLHEQGLTARGHPIFWNLDGIVPRWVRSENPSAQEMRQLFDARLEQMSHTVLPQLHDVDVFNELVHWERFTNSLSRVVAEQGKVPLVTHYLQETKRLNTNLLTVVNDYENGPTYYALLKQLLEAGAPIDIIGQQSHMHTGKWSVTQIWNILNRLTLLNRPVLFTEMSVLSGPSRKTDWQNNVPNWNTDPENEAKQADYLEQFFRLAYSHTNCIGVVLWDYADRRSWLGAPVGLLRKDGSPKPSFERLDKLINQQWRTRGEFITDKNGDVKIPAAFEGEYRISTGPRELKATHKRGAPVSATLKLVE